MAKANAPIAQISVQNILRLYLGFNAILVPLCFHYNGL